MTNDPEPILQGREEWRTWNSMNRFFAESESDIKLMACSKGLLTVWIAAPDKNLTCLFVGENRCETDRKSRRRRHRTSHQIVAVFARPGQKVQQLSSDKDERQNRRRRDHHQLFGREFHQSYFS